MTRKREFNENETLKKIMELFWLQGYEKTSMNELVNYTKVHRKSIYDTFGNMHIWESTEFEHQSLILKWSEFKSSQQKDEVKK